MTDFHFFATYGLLILILLVSFAAFNNYSVIERFRHYPYQENKDQSFYRWLTCGFVHGNYLHLFLNAFVLYQFGLTIESLYINQFGPGLGMLVYVSVYLVILVLSCAPTFFKHRHNPAYASIGASGAISGILFIYIYHFPFNMLYFYGIIPLPALLMGVLYLAYSWWAVKNTNDGIDHDAHYYGAVLGLLIAGILDLL
ncbi:MAG: rhomboid family intramembrane serine protease [Saprospiraceae bacterium]|nr:rhomboid family intramembrane serine protease [Saprospiraceae bacterium]MBK7811744.1 rhomboid family intramembrane serine protease [Saprospiraceae bacterium]MBK9631534.1 rhomboid family intramembrane serine protease [Saprospiraceae bacterium]